MEVNPTDKPEQDPDQGYEEVGTSTYGCLITGKDRRVVWRNFDNSKANFGIKREIIRTQVRENEEGRIQLEELIDPALVILSDIARENPEMDVLNNAKNSAVDSYRTTKWIYHEILELKHRFSVLEREIYSLINRVNEDELSMKKKMDAFNTRSLEMAKTLQGIAEKNYNILKDIESIKRFIQFGDEPNIGKE